MITIENVRFGYRSGEDVLREVNLTVGDGEFVAILGNNGSGKSTLMKLILGLQKPSAGRVLVNGVDTRTAKVSALARQVGFVFQNPNDQLFAGTVAEEIAFGLKNLGLTPDEIQPRVEAILARFDLTAVAETFPRFLARGDRQKVCIASVLALQPRILLLDEPTTGQDQRDSRAIMELARRLNQDGMTILLVTHDLINVAEYARRVLVLRDGAIVRDAPTADVLSDLPLLASCSLVAPQVVQLSLDLAGRGLPLALSVDALARSLAARLAVPDLVRG